MANGCLVCLDDHVNNVFPCFEDMTPCSKHFTYCVLPIPNNPLAIQAGSDITQINLLSFNMFPRTKSLFAIITLYLALIQGITGQSDDLPASQSTHQSDCTSDQIQKGDVKNCICHGSDHACDNKCP